MHHSELTRALVLGTMVALSVSACTIKELNLAGLSDKVVKAGGTGAGGDSEDTPTATTDVKKPSTKPSLQPTVDGHGHIQPPTASTAPVLQEDGIVAVNQTIGADVPAIYKKFYGASSVKVEGNYVVVVITGLPDHGSPYYEGSAFEDRVEANPVINWSRAPGSYIKEIVTTYKFPLKPEVDASHQPTPGQVGVAINGVPMFNQYQMDKLPLGGEVKSFDQYQGHPTPFGQYHYHVEPLWLTTKFGKEAFLGMALDGFPVYGPQENGKTLTNADLDTYHGHEHATVDFPAGIYHYHVTAEAPYINGDGFYGKPGVIVRSTTEGTTGGQTGQSPAPLPSDGTGGQPPMPSPSPSSGTGTQPQPPAPGSVVFSLPASYTTFPVKVELTPPHDTNKVVATLNFTAAGQKVTQSLPLAKHVVFVTVTGGTRTNKGTVEMNSGTTAVTLP